jgi:hypothetical protein
VSKEEFCSDKIKASLEKWVEGLDDLEAEFDKIDTNAGGQVHHFLKKSTKRFF